MNPITYNAQKTVQENFKIPGKIRLNDEVNEKEHREKINNPKCDNKTTTDKKAVHEKYEPDIKVKLSTQQSLLLSSTIEQQQQQL